MLPPLLKLTPEMKIQLKREVITLKMARVSESEITKHRLEFRKKFGVPVDETNDTNTEL